MKMCPLQILMKTLTMSQTVQKQNYQDSALNETDGVSVPIENSLFDLNN